MLSFSFGIMMHAIRYNRILTCIRQTNNTNNHVFFHNGVNPFLVLINSNADDYSNRLIISDNGCTIW